MYYVHSIYTVRELFLLIHKKQWNCGKACIKDCLEPKAYTAKIECYRSTYKTPELYESYIVIWLLQDGIFLLIHYITSYE